MSLSQMSFAHLPHDIQKLLLKTFITQGIFQSVMVCSEWRTIILTDHSHLYRHRRIVYLLARFYSVCCTLMERFCDIASPLSSSDVYVDTCVSLEYLVGNTRMESITDGFLQWHNIKDIDRVTLTLGSITKAKPLDIDRDEKDRTVTKWNSSSSSEYLLLYSCSSSLFYNYYSHDVKRFDEATTFVPEDANEPSITTTSAIFEEGWLRKFDSSELWQSKETVNIIPCDPDLKSRTWLLEFPGNLKKDEKDELYISYGSPELFSTLTEIMYRDDNDTTYKNRLPLEEEDHCIKKTKAELDGKDNNSIENTRYRFHFRDHRQREFEDFKNVYGIRFDMPNIVDASDPKNHRQDATFYDDKRIAHSAFKMMITTIFPNLVPLNHQTTSKISAHAARRVNFPYNNDELTDLVAEAKDDTFCGICFSKKFPNKLWIEQGRRKFATFLQFDFLKFFFIPQDKQLATMEEQISDDYRKWISVLSYCRWNEEQKWRLPSIHLMYEAVSNDMEYFELRLQQFTRKDHPFRFQASSPGHY